MEDGGSSWSENSEEPELDGDELEEPWMPSDEDEVGSQDLDQYEADCEDQDIAMDEDEDGHQKSETNEDENGTSNLKQNKEILEKSLLHEGNLYSNTPTSPQIAKPEPSPTLEPHHDPMP